MLKKVSLVLVLIVGLESCNTNLVFSEFKSMKDAKWDMSESVHFEFSGLDSIAVHNMFINVRNDNTFPFSNLFLITELEYPDGNTIKDTLEYRMAEPTGEWLGKGLGSIKENKLWFQEKIVFPDSGVYKVSVAHAMRRNGEVGGINILEGITDLGLEIEKSTQ
ncbi:gliding motility lipoprotein GldH [Flagellimonas nanhaiensis]|uniref:Gliding motility lipoprotein GldH n=1 Tax=Flagellimonas nanhaiensis TaxID=2292706 RepID=A0A371JQU8_9FLAO|nr:gliding motility lipoprotein GldH [Allomuricauda nanhaiensis]RDY59884.1 gliding motility lipoprotein GldH [Allomuricauda nanhaiensis]